METALEISEQAKVLSQLVQSSLDRLRSTDELHYSGGISLLTVKNDLLLSYIHHLVIIQLIKVTGHNLADHAPVISETIKSRVALEKVRPLEGKLKYQIEKLLRKAEVAAEGKDTAEELANGDAIQLFKQGITDSELQIPCPLDPTQMRSCLPQDQDIPPLVAARKKATICRAVPALMASIGRLDWQLCLIPKQRDKAKKTSERNPRLQRF